MPYGVTPSAVFQQDAEFVLPELIIGGEWTSTIMLANSSNTAIPPTNIFFRDNLGNPMKATFQTSSGSVITDTGFAFTLPPGAIVETTFVGDSKSQFGYAVIDICRSTSSCSSAGLHGEVTLRNRNSTRPDFESIFPLEQPTDLQYMLWDHRNGLSTVLYLVNSNTTPTVALLSFYDTKGQFILGLPVTLKAGESQILTVNSIAPSTIGLHGTLVIRGQNSSGTAYLTATGLRINPSNSFTPIRAFFPSR